MPLGSVLAGFRLCMTMILQRLQQLAPAHGLSTEEVLAGSTLLWSLGDAFSTRAVIAHQERSLAEAVADSGLRARWILDAVMTGLPRTELRSGAAAYGVEDREARALAAPRHDHRGDVGRRIQDWGERARVTALTTPHGPTEVGLVAPLEAEGEFGQFLLETVRAYLAHGLSIPRAAASIPVHVNTLRYRLKRFQELTGADLHDPEHLIEVSWALAGDPGAAGSREAGSRAERGTGSP